MSPATQQNVVPGKIDVVVTDVQIRFWSMVVLLIKVALAAIPAAIFLVLIVMLVGTFFAGYTGLLTR